MALTAILADLLFWRIIMTRQQLKSMAKEQIKGKIGILFLISLIISLISSAASAIPGVGSIAVAVVVGPAFSLATVRIYLAITKGTTPVIKDAFSCFNEFFPAFKTSFLVSIFTFLWSLLFVIPGIIKGISYSQAMYILAENPTIGAREAINRSKAMMEGHKMEYFVLGLSFSGWILVTVLTFGIAGIWTIPYMNATMANFYNEIKPQASFYTEANPEPF